MGSSLECSQKIALAVDSLLLHWKLSPLFAYRQPVTKPEVEAIRGVNCDQVLLSLLERNLIAITGRADSVGKPLLYGTTDDFLRAFGLNSLSDLPKLRELEELMEDDAYSATKPEGVPEEVTQELLELETPMDTDTEESDKEETEAKDEHRLEEEGGEVKGEGSSSTGEENVERVEGEVEESNESGKNKVDVADPELSSEIAAEEERAE